MTRHHRKQDLRIELLPTSSLNPNPQNARRHARKQIGKRAKIIAKLGLSVPIAIDDNNMILPGHARVEAAEELGRSEAPCIGSGDLSEADKIDDAR